MNIGDRFNLRGYAPMALMDTVSPDGFTKIAIVHNNSTHILVAEMGHDTWIDNLDGGENIGILIGSFPYDHLPTEDTSLIYAQALCFAVSKALKR